MVEFAVWAGLVRVAFRFEVELVRVTFGPRKVARAVLGPRNKVAPEVFGPRKQVARVVFGRWTELAVYGSPAAVQTSQTCQLHAQALPVTQPLARGSIVKLPPKLTF